MADDFVTFDNKFMMLVNPLPSITLAELHRRANVPLGRKHKQGSREVFDLELRYGGGEDLKTSSLRPGQQIRVPDRLAKEVIQDFKPSGDICSTAPGLAWFSKDEERRDAMLSALEIAATHYHTLGAGQVDSVRVSRGHRDDEVETRFRGSIYAPFHLCIAKERIIRERITELMAEPEVQKRKAG